MDEITHCSQTWQIILTPPLEFCEIEKEKLSQGHLYMIYDDLRTLGFISQSGPVLTKVIAKKTGVRLNYSAIYRFVRGDVRGNILKRRWKCKLFRRNELEEFNNYIKDFPSLFFITKNPDLYKFIPGPIESQSSERTFLTENEQAD